MKPEQLFEMIRSMETLAVACSAVELGVFEFLDSHEPDWRQWCRREGYDAGAMEALLNALTATGFLNKEVDGYRLSENGRRLKNDPFLSDHLRLANVYTVMFRFPQRIKNHYFHTLRSDELEIITALGKHSADPLIERLMGLIPSLKDRPLRLLDLGCGQGYHLAALGARNPSLRCRGIDAEGEVLNRARRVMENRGLHNITLEAGDMRTVSLGEDLDVIACFTALRGMGLDEMTRLVERIYHALKPGGYFVAHDFFLEDTRLEPVDNVFFDMKLALAATGGKVLQRKDFEEFKQAGFAEYQMIPLEDGDVPVQGSGLFLYRK